MMTFFSRCYVGCNNNFVCCASSFYLFFQGLDNSFHFISGWGTSWVQGLKAIFQINKPKKKQTEHDDIIHADQTDKQIDF
jgi:hypothetical protein